MGPKNLPYANLWGLLEWYFTSQLPKQQCHKTEHLWSANNLKRNEFFLHNANVFQQLYVLCYNNTLLLATGKDNIHISSVCQLLPTVQLRLVKCYNKAKLICTYTAKHLRLFEICTNMKIFVNMCNGGCRSVVKAVDIHLSNNSSG